MIKSKLHIEENNDALALGIVLFDQLLFSLFFQSGDLSIEPTVPQKLMFLDRSRRVLLCTSRNVAKTVSLIGRMMRDVATHLNVKRRKGVASHIDEIMLTTPTEGQLNPIVDKLFGNLTHTPGLKCLVKEYHKGDAPELITTTNLKLYARIEGTSGTDRNMVGIHPIKIYGDEQAFSSAVNHRSRLMGAFYDTEWVYAGVPNGVRGTPFYNLDQTGDGDNWSKHHMSALDANPRFRGPNATKHRKQLIKDYGGEHSPEYIMQVLGEWGDEAMSSFPPGSVSWSNDIPYFISILSGKDVEVAIKTHALPMSMRIPQVRCQSALIGWDYGFSPDPTTFLVAVQTGNDSIWRTYCRVSLYQTALPHQIEVLKFIVNTILSNRLTMLSVDSQPAYQLLISDDNKHIFQGKIKLTNQGGAVEIDLDTGEFIKEDRRMQSDIQAKRRLKRTAIQRRKYFLTEMFRRYMMNALLNIEGPKLIMSYDTELETELIGTVERRRPDSGLIVYEVPRQSARNRPAPDQIVDAARALSDCIDEIDRTSQKAGEDTSELVIAMGWSRRGMGEWQAPWSKVY